MPGNTPWTDHLDKISRQLLAGKKLSASGKATGRDLTDKDRERLEAEKAKWLQMKDQAKDAKHDNRVKKIQEHTTAVGDRDTILGNHTTIGGERNTILSGRTTILCDRTTIFG